MQQELFFDNPSSDQEEEEDGFDNEDEEGYQEQVSVDIQGGDN